MKNYYIFIIIFLFYSVGSYSQIPTENLQLWLKADNVEITDNKVSKWIDASINNHEIVQATANSRPSISSSEILNSQAVVSFNGTSQYLNGGNILNLSSSENTIIFIAKGSKGYTITKSLYGSANNRYGFEFTSSSFHHLYFDNAPHDFTYNGEYFLPGQYNFIIQENNKANQTNRYYINNNNAGVISNISTNAMESGFDFLIGAYNNTTGGVPPNSSLFLNGEIAEIIIYNKILDEEELDTVKEYLRSKYTPPVDLGQDIDIEDSFCDTVVKTANKPWFKSYMWSTGETTPTININKSGTYRVTVTDIFGLESYDEINVFFPEVNELTDTVACYGNSVVWNTELSENSFTFEWIGMSETAPSLSISEEGEYAAIITDSEGCKFYTDTISFVIDNYEFTASIGPQDTAFCSGNKLMLNTSKDETISYNWSTGSSEPEIVITESGNYSVTVTSERGCIAIDSIDVDIVGEAPAIALQVENLCFTDNTVFTDLSSSDDPITERKWYINNILASSSDSFEKIFESTGTQAIKFEIKTDAGCSNDTAFNITIKEIPVVDFSGTPICIDIETSFISAITVPENTSIESYIWKVDNSIAGTLPDLEYSFSESGIYNISLEVILDNQCSAIEEKNIEVKSEFAMPDNISLIYPTNNLNLHQHSEVDFSWNYYENLFYHLIIAEDEYFNNIIFSINNLYQSSYSAIINSNSDTVFWKVIAYNPCHVSIESETRVIHNYNPENTSSLTLWLSADNVVSNNGRVSAWNDRSGYNHQIIQSIETSRPEVATSEIINNAYTVKFNGAPSNYYLNGGNILNFGTASNTIICLVKSTSGYFISKSIAANRTGRYAYSINNNGFSNLYQDNLSRDFTYNGEHLNNNSFNFLHIENDRLNSINKYFINSFEVGERSINADFDMTSDFNFLIGAYNNATGGVPPSNYFNGEIAEIIMFDTILSNVEIENIKRYFQNKYSSTVNLGEDIYSLGNFCDTAIKTAYSPIFVDYMWSTGETDSVIRVDQSGTYSVTVTDIFGFKSYDEINVFFPKVNELTDTIACYGNSIIWDTELDESSFTFEWIGMSETAHSLTISEEGEYAAIITDSEGCKFYTDTISFVFDNYELTASIGPQDTAFCSGNKLMLNTSKDETISYNWSTGSSEPEIAITESGNYSVTVTSERGCIAIDSIDVDIVGEAPAIALQVENLCFTDNTVFTDLSSSNDPITERKWYINNILVSSSDSFEKIFESTGTQAIKFEIKTDAGCSKDTTFNITIKEIPIVDFSGTPICIDIETSFTSAIAVPENTSIESYIWRIDNSIAGNLPDLEYSFSESRIYNISLEVILDNQCSAIEEKNIEVSSEFELPASLDLVYPNNYLNIYQDTEINFSWNNYENMFYNLVIARDENFNNILFSITDLLQTEYSLLINSNIGSIFWKVIAYNPCHASIESETRVIYNFTPEDIQTLTLWLSADNVVAENGKVSLWTDQSNSNYQIIQSIETSRPEVAISETINNAPIVKFNGSSYLDGGNILNLESSSNTIICLVKGTGGYFMSKSIAADRTGRYAFLLDNSSFSNLYQDNQSRSFNYNGEYLNKNNFNFLQFENYRSHSANKYSLNSHNIGENSINAAFNMSSDYNFLIGAYNNATGGIPPSSYFNGEIAEIIIFDTILSNTEIDDIKRYFQDKYSKTVSLGRDIYAYDNFCDTLIKTAYNPIFIDYMWSTGETDSVIRVSKSGTYSVTVTDIFGFKSYDEINVSFPKVNELTDTVACYGNSIIWDTELDESTFSFEWTGMSETASSLAISEEGEYSAIITDSEGCKFYTDTISFVFDNYELTASIGPQDTLLCNGNRLMLVANSDETVSYSWSTGSSDPQIVVAGSGAYSVSVASRRGCVAEDTINVTIHGNAPIPAFENLGHCEKNSISFLDESTSNDYEIIEWKWKIGNVIVSEEQNLEYAFDESGVYNIQLTVKTAGECSDFINKEITIYPLPEISFSPDYYCQNTDINFISSSGIVEGSIVYNKWIFDNTDELVSNNVIYNFTSGGLHKVKLISLSNMSCSDSLEHEIFVRSAELPAYTTENTCINENTYFINNTAHNPNSPVAEWKWNFGDGSTSNYSDPEHIYTSAGIYNSKLEIVYSNGCAVSSELPVEIYYPPEISILNLNACLGIEYNPEILENSESGTIISYYWEIGDSFTSIQKEPDFISTILGKVPVKLEARTDLGCRTIFTDSININSLPVSKFSTQDYSGAIPYWVEFTNESENAVKYKWNFDDGNISDRTNPINIFFREGEYNVSLVSFTEYGCTDTNYSLIKAVSPVIDIVLFDLIVEEANGYLSATVSVLNNSNIPIYDLELLLNIGNGKIYREKLDRINDGAVITYKLNSEILNNLDFLCIEAYANILDTYADINMENNIVCNSNTNSIKVYSPYPNPVSSTLSCEIFTIENTNIEAKLSSFNGVAICHNKYENINGYLNIKIDVENLTNGPYILQIITDKIEKSYKIEVIK